jgi:hypothetical protein
MCQDQDDMAPESVVSPRKTKGDPFKELLENDQSIATAASSTRGATSKSYDMSYEDDEHRLKVIGDPLFADTRALILTCKFFNVPFYFKSVNTLQGEHRSDKFLKAHPCGHLPILVDGPQMIYGSVLIAMLHVCRKYEKLGQRESLKMNLAKMD